jgi:hypothetical protein
MHITEVEQRSGMEDWQVNPIARRHVANVEISAPFALAINTGGYFAVGSDA